MANFWLTVKKVIRESDILIEVLDARLVEDTRNKEIEDKVRTSGKTLIFVINKCDLVEKSGLERYKQSLRPCVFMSATEKLGTNFLRKEIMKQASNNKLKDKFKVGILGYPNTGKSSVINALKGRRSAPTSPVSGYTKGLQLIKISQRMYLLDTPGVFPYKEKDEKKHAIIAAKTYTNLKDPETAVIDLIETFHRQITDYYGVKTSEDPEEVLEQIALKLKKLKKGAKPDTNAASRIVLKDWQKGNIKQ